MSDVMEDDTADWGAPLNDSNKNSSVGQGEAAIIPLHPLLIEHVVEKVFSFFYWSYSNPNILSCRQVCRTWCNIITDGMKRSKLVRQLHFEQSDSDSGDEFTSLQKFVEDMRHSSNLPFDSFNFHVHFFTDRNTNAFSEFLVQHSPFVANLNLQFGKHYSLDLCGILQRAEENHVADQIDFCNLTALSFHCIHLVTMPQAVTKRSSFTWQPKHPRELSQGLLLLFKSILSSAKQLQKLDFHLPSHSLEGVDGKMANAQFAEVITHNLAETVKKLKLTMQLNDKHLDELCEQKRLKLIQLHLDIYGSHLIEQSLWTFICQQSDSLTRLRLVDFDETLLSSDQLYLGECKKVTTLTIKGDHLSILNNFPNLQKLVLLTPLRKSQTKAVKGEVAGLSVLEIALHYPPDSPTFIPDIPLHFPNVSVLRLQTVADSVTGIQAVFEHLSRNLVELEITFLDSVTKQSADSIFSGLPLTRSYNIAESRLFSDQDQQRVLAEVNRKPCLENLKHLRRLIIRIESASTVLTDVAAHYAFFRCSSLQEICIIGNHNISASCFRLLRTRFNMTQQEPTGATQTISRQLPEVPIEECWALVPVP